MQCLIVIASLCFTNVQRLEVPEPNSAARWATAQVGRGEVKILLSSDMFRSEFDPARMQTACAGGACLTYHKWCETGARLTCRYSTEASEHAEWLQISAPDAEAYAQVERSLGLVIGPSAAAIPLSELRATSASRTPPYCFRGGRGPQCPGRDR
jgi:hypothetical protein